MYALDILQLHGSNSWLDMIFDYDLVAAICQRLHLGGAEGFHPVIKPFGNSGLVRGLIGAIVNSCLDGRHFLANIRLGFSVDGPADRFSCAGVGAYGDTGLPGAVRTLPD